MRKVETKFYRMGCPSEPQVVEYLTVKEALEMVELTNQWGIDVMYCKLLPKGA